MKLTINVTQEDIDNGLREYTTECPIAMAIRRAYLPDRVIARVSDKIEIIRPAGGERETFSLPPNGAEIIHNFDAIGRMSPFEFELKS